MNAKKSIVSSAHLAGSGPAGLSELEYGLIVASGAFTRWVVRCMAAAGYPDLGYLDVLTLHSVNHRDRDKRAADICFVLGIEDTHTVTYALKKLVRLGLVERLRRGKEAYFTITDEGRAACATYGEVRQTCLLDALTALGLDADALEAAAGRLRALSGLYDQGARAAASL
ncbi:MAG TPA: winged helix DNA-binding protein [Magnetovibrio sp.]